MLRCLDWSDRVVPFPVEVVTLQTHLFHLFVTDRDAFWIGSLIDFRTDSQTGFSGGRADETHDGGQTHQRFTTPVHGDVREKPMLNLVPLAGARWIVAHGDGQARSVSELLQLPFPQTRPWAVATSGICCNRRRCRQGVPFSATNCEWRSPKSWPCHDQYPR